jgi:hypothetical protein
MAIFSAQDIGSYIQPGLGDTICSALPSWLSWLCVPPTQLEENLKDRQLFNQAYVSRQHQVRSDGVILSSFSEILGVAEGNCDYSDPENPAYALMYSFNYTNLPSTADLSYLVDFTTAELKTISRPSSNLFNIYLKNPVDQNTWPALTLLRNTGAK